MRKLGLDGVHPSTGGQQQVDLVAFGVPVEVHLGGVTGVEPVYRGELAQITLNAGGKLVGPRLRGVEVLVMDA